MCAAELAAYDQDDHDREQQTDRDVKSVEAGQRIDRRVKNILVRRQSHAAGHIDVLGSLVDEERRAQPNSQEQPNLHRVVLTLFVAPLGQDDGKAAGIEADREDHHPSHVQRIEGFRWVLLT
jgi:hypothetical protein